MSKRRLTTSARPVRSALIAAAALLAFPPGARAQDTRPAPATTGEPLVATITAIKGVVQVRDSEDQPWKPAAVGMDVDEGAEFRTGPRSAVQFVVPPDQTITLDRLGTIKVLQAMKSSGKVTTALGMKYGRTRYDIQAADLEHDSSIRSPGSTLAIRGTDVTFEDMAPFPPNATSREGRATFRNAKRQTVAFGGTARADVSAERASPAETAIVQTRADPQSAFSGRSEVEQNLVTQLPSLGGAGLSGVGVQEFQEQSRQEETPVVPIPPPPPPSTIVPFPLLIELKWSGAPFSDIDIRVEREGEVVSAGNGISPTGGRHLGNGMADSLGQGRETVLWTPTHPTGLYRLIGSGEVETENRIDVAQVLVRQDPDGRNTVVANFVIEDTPEDVDEVVREVTIAPFTEPAAAVPTVSGRRRERARAAATAPDIRGNPRRGR